MRFQTIKALVASSSLLPVIMLQDDYWGDELIVLALIERLDLVGIITVLPVHQPHYPTWYLVPEILGLSAAEALSIASLPVTVYFSMSIAQHLYDDHEASYVAGVLVAFSPYLAEQAGWLRMYAPLTALATMSFYCAITDQRSSSVLAVLASSLHIFGWLVNAWDVILKRDRWSAVGLAVSTTWAGTYMAMKLSRNVKAPGRSEMVSKTGMGHGIAPSLQDVAVTPVGALTGTPRFRFGVLIAIAVILLVLFSADKRLLLWMWLPIAFIGAVSHVYFPVWEFKYFGFIAPAIAIAVVNPAIAKRRRLPALFMLGAMYTLSYITAGLGAPVSHRLFYWFV